ncbi:MAG: NAD(P)-binding domain-containing protein, partial [Deltaproteobacteria bacterium]|nr:NAD(P)-binding domain-containing protein [Deltaproteobacteria bacterium]
MTQTIDNKIIGFLGAGKMAEALTHGIISSGLAKPMQVITADKDASRLEHIKESYDIRTYTKAIEVAKIADILIIAVKPQDVKGLLEEIKSEVSEKTLIISIAAGITTDFILKALASDKTAPTVIRCMPNTPALLGAGAIGLFIKDNTPKDDIEVAENILNAVGSIVKVSEESLLDAVTGLSGSGPAYCFLFLKALT